MTENNGTIIEDVADPQAVSFTPETAEPKNPVEAAMQAMEKNGATFGNEDDVTPEPVKDEKKADEKAEEKEPPKVEDKTKEKPVKARAEDGKFAKAEMAEQESVTEETGDVDGEDGQENEQEKRSSGERETDRPPARFLASAKAEWSNTPQSVRDEVYRAMKNMDDGIAEYRQDREFRKSLSNFESMANQAGTTVPDAIARYVAIDQELRTNPSNAIQRILATINLTPEQYAQHVMGQAQQQRQNPQMAQNNALQQQVNALTQQIQQLTQGTQQDREIARLAEVERSIIAPFAAEHPRYHELQDDIAFFLNSGKIPSNLPEQKRLEEAYFMAEQINPVGEVRIEGLSARTQRPINPAGKKSIKGAPSGATPAAGANLSGKEAIDFAMRKMGL